MHFGQLPELFYENMETVNLLNIIWADDEQISCTSTEMIKIQTIVLIFVLPVRMAEQSEQFVETQCIH